MLLVKMRFLLLVCLFIYGMESIHGSSIVINNDQVYIDGRPVDLSRTEVVEETPTYTRYRYNSGNTQLFITKSKHHNGISISSTTNMTPEEAARAREFSRKFNEKMKKNMKHMQTELESEMKQMKSHLQSMFGKYGSFF